MNAAGGQSPRTARISSKVLELCSHFGGAINTADSSDSPGKGISKEENVDDCRIESDVSHRQVHSEYPAVPTEVTIQSPQQTNGDSESVREMISTSLTLNSTRSAPTISVDDRVHEIAMPCGTGSVSADEKTASPDEQSANDLSPGCVLYRHFSVGNVHQINVSHIGSKPARDHRATSFCQERDSSLSIESGIADDGGNEEVIYADALWDHITMDADELTFTAGDVIEVTDMADSHWWGGTVHNHTGWFPASFVRLRVVQDEVLSGSSPESSSESPVDNPDLPTTSRVAERKKSSRLFKKQMRSKVIEEIMDTEKVYTRHLEDVVEGFMAQAKQKTDMFDENRLSVIFSNISDVLVFQKEFYSDLQEVFDRNNVTATCVGEVFIKHRENFAMYSCYCNNQPLAVQEMTRLREIASYKLFFEACRLLRQMDGISLEGYLLTPVQKICKYPLQLNELLKHTPYDHPDYEHVKEAKEVMTGVAQMINERKRRVESVETISKWQDTIIDWQGANVLKTSSMLIFSGEIQKISKGHSQPRMFFLFDHQLVWCKRDAISRDRLIYKGRVSMDDCEIINLQDGETMYNNQSVKNAWKMNNTVKSKWYILYCATAEQKARWLCAFEDERRQVASDEDQAIKDVVGKAKLGVTLARNCLVPNSSKSLPKSVSFSMDKSSSGPATGHQKRDSPEAVGRTKAKKGSKMFFLRKGLK